MTEKHTHTHNLANPTSESLMNQEAVMYHYHTPHLLEIANLGVENLTTDKD